MIFKGHPANVDRVPLSVIKTDRPGKPDTAEG